MTEWTYPGDDAVRRAFARNILKIIKAKGLTIEEFERRLAEARKGLDAGVHERAFGRAVRRLRQERKMTRKALAVSAGIPVRVLIQVERGHGGCLISVPEVCQIAAALKLFPHELMAHYQDAVEQANSAQARWRP
jgi:transcriptional regulator with XRE-family HTH domain